MVVAIVMAATIFTSLGGADTTIPDPGWSVTLTSPTTNLVDGQRVTVNVKANSDVVVGSVEIRQCRLDTTYTERADVLPSGAKCPATPLSSSADQIVLRSGSGIVTGTRSATGATLTFRVGVGQVALDADNTLACDPSHGCALVIEIHTPNGYSYVVEPLTFTESDPVVGCGGTAPGALTSAASDQLSDAWAVWTLDACKKPDAPTGAPTTASFGGEGSAVQAFASGGLDLAYSAVGYDADVGLAPTDPTQRRAAVATPVALNAAVIAVGGGFIQSDTKDKAPYPEIKMTAAQVSALFTGGIAWAGRVDKPYATGIFDQNPVLNQVLTAPSTRPMAPTEAESSSWFMTKFLSVQSPTDWVVPFAGTPRGATSALATAEPPFPDLDLYSGRPVLNKVVDAAARNTLNEGPIWVLTDLATAKALGMTPVSIQNAAGEFVAPTGASMQAAVETMKPDADGVLLPDSGGGASVHATDTVTPYPLTYVEYALAPAEPLVDATCAARPASQTLLKNWLTYLTTDGQKVLPAGLVALPDSLAGGASAAIAKVGASPVTGRCAATGAPNATGPTGAASGLPVGSVPGGLTSASRLPTTGAAAAASAADAAGQGNEAVVAIPAFAGHTVPDGTDGIVALLGIVLLTSLAAWVTSGRGAGAASPALAVAGAGAVGGGAGVTLPRIKPGPLVALWSVVAIAGLGLVVYQLGPLLQLRDQHDLIAEYRTNIRQAANESAGLPGVSVQTKAPADASPVGVVEIGALQSQQVVVEGVTPSDTRKAPGHVPGTAGLGQPGNSVVVARRNAFGGAFGDLGELRKGTRVLVTTTQGQSVYVVRSVRTQSIVDGSAESASVAPTTVPASTAPPTTTSDSNGATATTSATKVTAASTSREVTTDALYGPSTDDRLTLVTSASRAPWNSSQATVVVAKLAGKPFAPTPQGGRTDQETGRSAEPGVWPAVILALALYAGAIAASVALYRKLQFRVAYLLTIAPLVALTIVTGQTLVKLFPAWM